MYGVRNLEMTIRFSLKSRPSERFPRPEMSQIKAEISLRTNVKLIFHKNVGEIKLGYYADAECSDMPLLQTCILFAGGVCMSECAASAQGPNFTSLSIFHFI